MILLIAFGFSKAYGQNSFIEFDVNSKPWYIKKWSIVLNPMVKRDFNAQSWTLLGLSTVVSRDLFKQFVVRGGLSTKYTVDKSSQNNLELRPWAGIRLVTPVFQPISLRQELRFEWRNFFYADGTINPDAYLRSRYHVWIEFPFLQNAAKNTGWRFSSGYEWYFLKNPSSGERYPSSNELTFSLTRNFKNGHGLSLAYIFERFYKIAGGNHKPGNTIQIGYNF